MPTPIRALGRVLVWRFARAERRATWRWETTYGGLLSAVALMAKGWDGGPPAPGFPDTWTVRQEGLLPMP
jgi:hypothetical protein